MDYGLEPPEINSGRMYAGVGPAPMMASAAAWQSLTVELGLAGGSFLSTIEELAGTWMGPSSLAMLASGLEYVKWVALSAAQAETRAAAATQAAGAFETAWAGVVPPIDIARNRIQLATLVATNFLGMNTPAIMATEADYERMWAQDASALYAFAAQANTIATETASNPFIPPEPTTNPVGMAAQTGAAGESAGQSAGQAVSQVTGAMGQLGGMGSHLGDVGHVLNTAPQAMSALPNLFQSFASGGMKGMSPANLGSIQSFFNPLVGTGMMGQVLGFGSGMGGSIGAVPGITAGTTGLSSPVTATMGKAWSFSGSGPKLSVPATWANTVTPVTSSVRPLETMSTTSTDGWVAGAGAAPRGMMIPPGAAATGDHSGGYAPQIPTAVSNFYRDGQRPRPFAPPRVLPKV